MLFGLASLALLAGTGAMVARIVHIQEGVRSFNKAVESWEGQGPNTFNDTNSVMLKVNDGFLVQPQMSGLSIGGDTKALHATYVQSLVFQGTATGNQMHITNNKNSKSITFYIPPPSVSHQSLYCSCVAGHSPCSCDNPRELCPQGYNSDYSGASRCGDGQYCGECYQFKYVSRMCLAIDMNEWSVDYDNVGCTYPFENLSPVHDSSERVPVNVTLRNSKDPYFVLSRITKGSNNIETSSMKCSIIAGLVAVIFGMLACHCCRTRKGSQPNTTEYVVFAAAPGVNYGSATYPQPPLMADLAQPLPQYPPAPKCSPYGTPVTGTIV
jgi:hypothetical protein